jgi:hypothetical protein
MINLIDKCVTLQGSTNGCDIRKRNKDKSWNEQLQYTGKGIIQRGAIEEEEYEELFFTPPESPTKSLSSNCNANTMLDLKEHFISNFNMWSLNENLKIKNKKWEGEIKVNKRCGILV